MAKARAKSSSSAGEAIALPAMKIQTIEIPIIGDSPLICHRFSDRAKKQMLDKQMKKATTAREAKDPKRDYEESLYRHPDGGYGFPAGAFKEAAVDACRQLSGMPMTKAVGAFHIAQQLVKLKGTPTPREDVVRLETGVADLRYRAEFKQWSTRIVVHFNADVVSAEQLINLFNMAGFSVGVGDWRPGAPRNRGGSFGRFHVQRKGEKL